MTRRPANDNWPVWLIALHWGIALALLVMVGAGLLMVAAEEHAAATGDYTVKVLGVPLYQAYQLHKSIGITLFALILMRLGLRIALRVSGPDHDHPLPIQMAAGAAQVVLYLLMLSMPITGWLLAASSPLGLPTLWFGSVNIPHPVGPSAEREAVLATLHRLGGYALLGLAGLHALAALKHHLLDRDGTLHAMLPILPNPETRQ